MKHSFQNFQVDHMTLLMQPRLYRVAYPIFKIIFGITPADLLYEKRAEWVKGEEESMTFASCIGKGASPDESLNKTIIAVVQPSEPKTQSSHVRTMLDSHKSATQWQHIALRTPDLLAFHKFAMDRGLNFITPILRDDQDDLIQVFSGEWYYPGIQSSAMFFEFLQRNPTAESVQKLEEQNRESWFRDKTFLGLYGEKEKEYQTGNVTPFISFELFEKIEKYIGEKKLWEITEDDIGNIEKIMLDTTREANK